MKTDFTIVTKSKNGSVNTVKSNNKQVILAANRIIFSKNYRQVVRLDRKKGGNDDYTGK